MGSSLKGENSYSHHLDADVRLPLDLEFYSVLLMLFIVIMPLISADLKLEVILLFCIIRRAQFQFNIINESSL